MNLSKFVNKMANNKILVKIFTNKYVLYLLVFVSISHIVQFLLLKKFNSIGLFVLIALLTHYFTQNMSIVLFVSLIVTNIVLRKNIIEGLDNKISSKTNPVDKLSDVDKTSADALKVLNKSKNAKEAKEIISANQKNENIGVDKKTDSEPDGAGQTIASKHSSGSKKPYIDNAATMSEAYQNLQKMIGKDGLKQMTNETKSLMTQQKELFKSMQDMKEPLKDAMAMLKGIDLKNLSGLASSFSMPK